MEVAIGSNYNYGSWQELQTQLSSGKHYSGRRLTRLWSRRPGPDKVKPPEHSPWQQLLSLSQADRELLMVYAQLPG